MSRVRFPQTFSSALLILLPHDFLPGINKALVFVVPEDDITMEGWLVKPKNLDPGFVARHKTMAIRLAYRSKARYASSHKFILSQEENIQLNALLLASNCSKEK